jgi:hypothetical protein
MSTEPKRIEDIPPMTEERQRKLLEMPDEDIDYSDIPPLDEEFFKNAKLVKRESRRPEQETPDPDR